MGDQETTKAYEGWTILENEWRSVVGFEGLYEVDPASCLRRIGKAKGVQVGRILKPHEINGGYLVYQLWKDGKPKTVLAHVVVAHAFLGPCPQGLEVNHKDGNKKNNHVSNLEYMTHAENNLHAYRTGLRKPIRGEASVKAKLTQDFVDSLRAEHAAGLGCRALGRKHGLAHTTVGAILREESWKKELRS